MRERHREGEKEKGLTESGIRGRHRDRAESKKLEKRKKVVRKWLKCITSRAVDDGGPILRVHRTRIPNSTYMGELVGA